MQDDIGKASERVHGDAMPCCPKMFVSRSSILISTAFLLGQNRSLQMIYILEDHLALQAKPSIYDLPPEVGKWHQHGGRHVKIGQSLALGKLFWLSGLQSCYHVLFLRQS